VTPKNDVKMVCVDCGATYPRKEIREWGRHEAHAGLGPSARCYHLVPNGHIAPVPPDKDPDDFPLEKRRAHQLCGGPLVMEA